MRQQPFYASRQPGIHRHYVVECTACKAKILVVIRIDHRLVVHGGVNGGGTALLYAEGFIEHAYHRHQAVGGAGTCGHYPVCFRKLGLVNAEDHGAVDIRFCRLGKQQSLCACLKMQFGCCSIRVCARAFQHQIDIQFFPRQLRRV